MGVGLEALGDERLVRVRGRVKVRGRVRSARR